MRARRTFAAIVTTAVLAAACTGGDQAGQTGQAAPAGDSAAATTTSVNMDEIGEQYARLVLAMGVHDADYVDAYYGPPAWRTQADSAKLPVDSIRARAQALLGRLGEQAPSGADSLGQLRHGYLRKQLDALVARADMLAGTELSFDEESRALYDAEAPTNDSAHFEGILARLDSVLPGTGPVPARYERFRREFVIPPAKLDTVFRAAVAACRARTLRHVTLPDSESFTIEYVTDKPWSGYNWYQGGYKSLIQVNTDLPIFIDRALDLACHEGYPGHHVYNVLLEKNLVRDRGWPEYSVYPLFSPQSLIAEGSANYGIAMAFPGDERVAFERDSLFPLAGLDSARAAEYYRVQGLTQQLSYAGNEAARRYLNGQIDSTAAAEWLVRYGLYTPQAARQRVRFMDKYRSYVINYNLGQDIVRQWVERTGGSTPEQRWNVFAQLLSTPRWPSALR